MSLEERIAGLEGSYKELTKHIDDLRSETHRGFDGIRAELNDLRTGQQSLKTELKAEIAELRIEFRSGFRWTPAAGQLAELDGGDLSGGGPEVEKNLI